MDIHQLKTFVVVAREGSIKRAAELLHLSQPAVSAHIKAIEDTLALALFERTSRGMTLTRDGQRLLTRAEQTLAAHQALMDEATRIKGHLAGTLRLGAGSNSHREATGHLLKRLAGQYPDIEVILKHGTSIEILAGIRNGSLDAGFYNEPATPDPELGTTEVSHFKVYLAARPGLVPDPTALDWAQLADVPWIFPTASACCGQTAERLFKQHHIRPKRIISVDREDLTHKLITDGLGVGLLHADTALAAQTRGEVELLHESPDVIRVLFAHLASRAQDPLLTAATTLLRTAPT